MSEKSKAKILIIALVAIMLSAAAQAAPPRYADKESALEISQVIDKGLFRGNLISSTFVQSAGRDKFELKVVMENGGEHIWDMNDIRMWTQDGLITLTRNRALVFPSKDSNEYAVLDKNLFSQQALRARVFQRIYRGKDILAGQTILFGVSDFNMIELLDIKPARDDHGYLHQYVFDLANGERLFLSYLDAYHAVIEGALLNDEAQGQPVQRTPYKLLEIRSIPLQRFPDNGTGRFGFELVFDRQVELEPGHFPFRIYEENYRGRAPRLENPFVIEFTAPNSEVTRYENKIESVEFLSNVRGVNDRINQKRVLLRANMQPEVLNIPPVVEVDGEIVRMLFTKVEDQSVFDRGALEKAEYKHRHERLLASTLNEEEVQQRSLFRQHMTTGLAQLDKARGEREPNSHMSVLELALVNFKEAALNSSSDLELEEALAHRNMTMNRMAQLIVKQVRIAFRLKAADAEQLAGNLAEARSLARDHVLLEDIRRLEKDLKKR